ncbi:hypothetical protein [Maribacter sp.]|uniref:hypothetical protein n=1 Tax=Maribacter sp. TaxID=1897614 RepID=UPI0025C0D81F|nr:hypothetical protein [Maribacter sp.]
MKLLPEHLIPYTPYKLKVYDSVSKTAKIMNLGQGASNNWVGVKTVLNYYKKGSFIYKPILRPLSDLKKIFEVDGKKIHPISILQSTSPYIMAEENGFVDYVSGKYIYVHNLSYWIVLQLMEWHFDVRGLIKHDLAIDINTLE